MIPCPDIACPHGFLSNEGGVSSGVYTSLNCGPGSDDLPENIAENRKRVAEHLSGGREIPLLSLYQHHSSDVVTVTEDWGEDRPKADAMVTKKPGLILGILTADCTPVLFADTKNGVVGAAHAGWKGALSGVLENTIVAMETLGADRQEITAAIGPTIHSESYEVTREFLETFTATDSSYNQYFTEGRDADHLQFNLPGFVTDRLKASEVQNIWNAGVDTYTSPAHFSYRRTCHRKEPDYGRQVSAIMLSI